MPAMSTKIFRKPSIGSEIYGLTDHDTALRTAIVIVKRKPASGKSVMAEVSIGFIIAPSDATNVIMTQKNAFTLTHRLPITGDASTYNTLFSAVKDFVQSTAFEKVFTEGREIPEIV